MRSQYTLTNAARVTAHVREYGHLTIFQIAQNLAWSNTKVGEAVRAARNMGLLTCAGKSDRQQLIFAAVQTADWPPRKDEHATANPPL
jgi:hypothetical protein